MVDLDIIILSVLLSTPAHGYKLKQTIEDSFGSRYFKLSNSLLYPRLARLESEGIIEGKKEAQDKVPDKKVYHITDAGRKRLVELISTPVKQVAMPGEAEYELLVKATNFILLTKEQRNMVIKPMHDEKLREYEEAVEKREKFYQYMNKFSLAVLDHGIEQLKLNIAFYKKLMEMD
jgi:DNA-binding PadR family transcriptional regulator